MRLHFKERQTKHTQHKKVIVRKVLAFIKPGQVVLVGPGTSAVAVITALPRDISLTVITNSFPVVSVLEDYPNARVILLAVN